MTPRAQSSFRAPMRLRTMAAFGVIALAVSSFIAIVCFVVTRNTLVEQREGAAERQAFLNARAVRSALRLEDAAPLDALTRVQASSGGASLLQIDGQWFASAVGASGVDVPRSLLDTANTGSAARQRIEWNGVPTVAVATPILEADGIYVELVSMGDVARTLNRLRQALAVAAAVATGLGILAGRAASGRLLRPVRRMADAASAIREGALDQRLEADGDTDLEPLVDSFNSMVEGLQERIDRESRFASDVSHEMRSPLATMAAALSVTRRRVEDPDGLAALGLLEGEVNRFSGLVSDLLEISRSEAGVVEIDMDAVDAAEFARMVLASTDHGHVALVVECETGTRIELDKRRIGQALTNLLQNADNYAGGAKALRVSCTADEVVFGVEDDGPGIPDHERSYVFERFARGSNAETAGTGLGLALVQEHVRLHDGIVQVGDAPGGGARFAIHLPRGPR